MFEIFTKAKAKLDERVEVLKDRIKFSKDSVLMKELDEMDEDMRKGVEEVLATDHSKEMAMLKKILVEAGKRGFEENSKLFSLALNMKDMIITGSELAKIADKEEFEKEKLEEFRENIEKEEADYKKNNDDLDEFKSEQKKKTKETRKLLIFESKIKKITLKEKEDLIKETNYILFKIRKIIDDKSISAAEISNLLILISFEFKRDARLYVSLLKEYEKEIKITNKLKKIESDDELIIHAAPKGMEINKEMLSSAKSENDLISKVNLDANSLKALANKIQVHAKQVSVIIKSLSEINISKEVHQAELQRILNEYAGIESGFLQTLE